MNADFVLWLLSCAVVIMAAVLIWQRTRAGQIHLVLACYLLGIIAGWLVATTYTIYDRPNSGILIARCLGFWLLTWLPCGMFAVTLGALSHRLFGLKQPKQLGCSEHVSGLSDLLQPPGPPIMSKNGRLTMILTSIVSGCAWLVFYAYIQARQEFEHSPFKVIISQLNELNQYAEPHAPKH